MNDAADETISGTLELEESDLHAAIIDTSPLLRARFAIAAVLALSYVLLAFVAHAARRDMVGPIICGAVLAGTLFLTPKVRARQLLEALTKGGDRHASFRFDGEGVTFRTAGSTTTSAYRSLVAYREGKTAFLVYQSPGVANVIPKRAFSPEDVARVSARLLASVKRRGGVARSP
jgi:hypothetical protein